MKDKTVLLHRLNNAAAATMMNLDFVSNALGDASPDVPLLEDASPEQRAELLKSLSFALRSCRRVVELLRDVE